MTDERIILRNDLAAFVQNVNEPFRLNRRASKDFPIQHKFNSPIGWVQVIPHELQNPTESSLGAMLRLSPKPHLPMGRYQLDTRNAPASAGLAIHMRTQAQRD